jgi:hypothetical protein
VPLPVEDDRDARALEPEPRAGRGVADERRLVQRGAVRRAAEPEMGCADPVLTDRVRGREARGEDAEQEADDRTVVR